MPALRRSRHISKKRRQPEHMVFQKSETPQKKTIRKMFNHKNIPRKIHETYRRSKGNFKRQRTTSKDKGKPKTPSKKPKQKNENHKKKQGKPEIHDLNLFSGVLGIVFIEHFPLRFFVPVFFKHVFKSNVFHFSECCINPFFSATIRLPMGLTTINIGGYRQWFIDVGCELNLP